MWPFSDFCRGFKSIVGKDHIHFRPNTFKPFLFNTFSEPMLSADFESPWTSRRNPFHQLCSIFCTYNLILYQFLPKPPYTPWTTWKQMHRILTSPNPHLGNCRTFATHSTFVPFSSPKTKMKLFSSASTDLRRTNLKTRCGCLQKPLPGQMKFPSSMWLSNTGVSALNTKPDFTKHTSTYRSKVAPLGQKPVFWNGKWGF